jgi:hypothetical protein
MTLRRKGDAAAGAAANLGISRATWFRHRKAGLIETPSETPKPRKLRINSTHTMKERSLDAYFTPPCAVHALMKLERLPRAIADPCCGAGAILDVLAAGHDVYGLDIQDYGWPGTVISDYLASPCPMGETAIVTNPPYRLALQFIQKALADGAPYAAFLARLNFLEGQQRRPFFEKHPPSRIWVSSARLPMMHRQGWEGKKASSNMTFAWFVWDSSPDKMRVGHFNWKELSPLSKAAE